MWKFIRELLADNTGALSSTRLMSLSIVGVILVVFLVHNILAMIHHLGFQDLGIYAASAIAVAMTSKLAGAFIETRQPPMETDDPEK
jgi:arginine exporter protein ArgO